MSAAAKKGFVISDTHIMAKRSRFSEIFDTVKNKIKTADLFVLNGDIFDFKWCGRAHDVAIVESRKFLEELCDVNPECNIYYVLGNHDALPLFIEELAKINKPNFHWSATHFLLGDKLFIHGDLPLEGGNLLKRTPHDIKDVSTKRSDWLYDLMLNVRLHYSFDYIVPTKRTSRRILNSIERFAPELLAKVNAIYFGHTHVPENNFEYKGVKFFNTGCGIKNSIFNPVDFEVSA